MAHIHADHNHEQPRGPDAQSGAGARHAERRGIAAVGLRHSRPAARRRARGRRCRSTGRSTSWSTAGWRTGSSRSTPSSAAPMRTGTHAPAARRPSPSARPAARSTNSPTRSWRRARRLGRGAWFHADADDHRIARPVRGSCADRPSRLCRSLRGSCSASGGASASRVTGSENRKP